jgi:two-component system alkaline phosphatase synthesis response regulator PhoP
MENKPMDTMTRKTILVVDDEPRLTSLINSYLSQEGFRGVIARNGEEALELAEQTQPDLVILDIMMPVMDGFEFMQKFRRKFSTPVIILTAKVMEDDQLKGFELGADDYVQDPCCLASRGTLPVGANLQVSDILLDRENRVVKVKEKFVDLTPSEFDLLTGLMTSPGKVFSRLELLDIVQGVRYIGYERTIDLHIKNLRAKVEDDPHNPVYIETVYGAGYRFKREG